MAGEIAKQYLPLFGKTVIEHSLQRLHSHASIAGMVVAMPANDDYGQQLLLGFPAQGKPLLSVSGGAERAHSVLNALRRLAEIAQTEDWVLVHDAVRPCLRHEDIDKLVTTLHQHPVGGLLGVRVNDTMKRVDAAGNILQTLDREQLWHAQTPQMFRLGLLTEALSHAIEHGLQVTDEASAMALTGVLPAMVEGHADNIKITRAPDLILAQFYLEQQETQP